MFSMLGALHGQAQTNALKFTETKATDERAIQLRWQSKTNGVYRLEYTPQLSGNIAWDTLVDFFPSQGTNTVFLDTGKYWTEPALPQALVSAAFAAEPPLRDFCESLNGKDCEVIWAAPTNLPTSVKIFTVVPTKFLPNTISNLLQIAELAPKDKIRPTQGGVLGGKDVLEFANKKDTRHLDIIPSQGTIGLGIEGTMAQIPKEMPVGVPDDNETLRLALDFLKRIGINQSELATNANGKFQLTYSEESVLHKDKPSRLLVTNVVSREIHLRRQIDDLPVWGTAGISMKFGNQGKLAYLSVVWRTVKPERDCQVPNASEFVNRIKTGRVLIRNEQATTAYKKLTITKASLYYWESSGSEPQTEIYPFVVLDAKPDQQDENSNMQLFVPFASN